MPCPTSRAIGRALATLQALPPPALALLAERLIDTLDGAHDTDADLDVDDWPLTYPGRDGGAGDEDDAEENGPPVFGAPAPWCGPVRMPGGQ